MADLRFPRINSIMLSGRLTRDVELKYTASGTPVARLPLAFSRGYKDASGDFKEITSYIDVVVWKRQAEICAEQLHKGSPVLIEGTLQTRSWVDKDNQNRKTTEINAFKVNILEWSGNNNNNNSHARNTSSADFENTVPDVTDDDVPF